MIAASRSYEDGKKLAGVASLRHAWNAFTAADVVLEFVPLLARGRHAHPRDGASLLELVAVYAQEPWSICPPSVNRALATAAQAVNDATSDRARRQLIPLVPFLAETGGRDPKVSHAVAAVWFDAALHLADAKVSRRFRAAKEDAARWAAALDGPKRFGLHRPAHLHRIDAAIGQAVAAVAGAEPEGDRRDLSLRMLLVAATTAARRARGLCDATPSIPVVEPDNIRVVRQWVAEPGCDWLTLVCRPASEAEHARVFGRSPRLDSLA